MRWLLEGGHGWPHGDLPTWLITHDTGLAERVGTTAAPLHARSGEVQPVLDEMERDGRTIVWLCGGGNLAGQVLAAGGIDTVVATIAPTVLGEGPALFDAAGLPANQFELTEHRRSGTALRAVWRRRT